uniref:Uncharacterized protein n=1 Tax=Cacopsylla melanoneura TaxID=428564 RepID=A0A8D8TI77_9HEMI
MNAIMLSGQNQFSGRIRGYLYYVCTLYAACRRLKEKKTGLDRRRQRWKRRKKRRKMWRGRRKKKMRWRRTNRKSRRKNKKKEVRKMHLKKVKSLKPTNCEDSCISHNYKGISLQ